MDVDRPSRRPDVECARLADGSAVLVDPVSGTSHALNDTGAFIWQRCDGRHTRDQIAGALLERYDATAAEARAGVDALLEHLGELRLLRTTASDLPYVSHYDMLGFGVEVASDSPDYLALLDRLNAEFRRPPPEATAPPGPGPADVAGYYEAFSHQDGRLWELTFQGEELGWRGSLYKAVTFVEWHMCERAIARRQDLLHVHSAALAGAGASILLPGKSGIGKTTFALAVALRGLRLLSDDVVFIRPQTRQPECFPRQFHVHDDALPRLEPLGLRYTPDDHIGAHLCSTVLGPWDRSPGPPVEYIVFPQLRPDEPVALEPMPVSQAAVELMRYSKNLRSFPRHGLDLVSSLLDGVACYTLRRNDDLAAAADLIVDLVNAGPR